MNTNNLLNENQTSSQIKDENEAKNKNDYEAKIKNDYEAKIKKLEKLLSDQKEMYENEIHSLKNALLDKEYEEMLENKESFNKESFERLDEENERLRNLLHKYYKKELQDWYTEVRSKLEEMKEN